MAQTPGSGGKYKPKPKPKPIYGMPTMPGIPQPGMPGAGRYMPPRSGDDRRSNIPQKPSPSRSGDSNRQESTPTPPARPATSGPGSTKDLQRLLGIQQDGIYGPQTRAAVMEYQRRNGLTPDGVAGPLTWKAIRGGGANSSPAPSGGGAVSPVGAGHSHGNVPGPAPVAGPASAPTSAPSTNPHHPRLEKIAQDIMSGQRSMNDVRTSLDRLAGKPASMDYNTINDAPFTGDLDALIGRLGQAFTNRGVGLDQYLPVGNAAQRYVDNAQSAVDMELNPMLGAIDRQMELGQRQHDRDYGRAEEFGGQQERDLAELYKRLGGFQSALQEGQNARFDATEQEVAGNYAGLLAQLQGIGGGAVDSANSEIARLGLQEANPASVQGISRDSQFLQGLSQVDANNAQTNMGNQQLDYNALMSMMRGNAASEGTMQMGNARRDTGRRLEDLTNTNSDRQFDLGGKRADLEATRGERMRQILEGYQERDWSHSMEERQMNFSQDLANRQFGLDKAQFDSAQAAQQAAMNQEPSYLDQLQVSKTEAEIAAILAKLNPPAPPPPVYYNGPNSGRNGRRYADDRRPNLGR